ncbi:hypothetical protein R3W88_008869 [Solanum pinnatisectum]|uniref:Uncharacterized protein n=1 Tax=Solanum pinnatisectum TaxID=50273 RepID=A0AAV9M9V5_9SOLN|nr:hypothetical protein R3W88_008869 [Solanum pinnatisectum]
MTSFEHNVMVALYWGGEIITDMNGFRYTECARMIISMSTSTNYVELVGLLHEKMGTNSENIHMNISGKYPCSIQEIMRPTLIYIMMQILKLVMKVRRKTNLQKMVMKVNLMKISMILNIFLKMV